MKNIFLKIYQFAVCDFVNSAYFFNKRVPSNLMTMDAKYFDFGFVTIIVTQTAIEHIVLYSIVQIYLANGGV